MVTLYATDEGSRVVAMPAAVPMTYAQPVAEMSMQKQQRVRSTVLTGTMSP